MHELFFGTNPLWLHALPSLDAVRRSLVLSQLDIPCFLCLLALESLPLLNGEGGGVNEGGSRREVGGGNVGSRLVV